MSTLEKVEKLLRDGYKCVEVRSSGSENQNIKSGFSTLFKKKEKLEYIDINFNEKIQVNLLFKKYKQWIELE